MNEPRSPVKKMNEPRSPSKTTNKLPQKKTYVDVSIINKKNLLEQQAMEQKIESQSEFNMARKSPQFKTYIKKAFEKYDEDASGELDYHELRNFLNDLRNL